MKYLLLIYEDEKRFANGFNPEEMAQYGEFGKRNAGVIKGGHALKPTATAKSVRVRDGKVSTTDGPFAETKEHLGGFYLVEADSDEHAARLAAEIPGARYGVIEVRQIETFS